jgi:uncharacterized membrane protein YeaQ/YmgE (transglycosylase-associated protein family)
VKSGAEKLCLAELSEASRRRKKSLAANAKRIVKTPGGVNVEILSWLIFGLLAGALAKLIMPGDDPGEAAITLIIGVVGAVIVGFIAVQLGYDDIIDLGFRGFVIVIIGVLVLLGGYQLLRRS